MDGHSNMGFRMKHTIHHIILIYYDCIDTVDYVCSHSVLDKNLLALLLKAINKKNEYKALIVSFRY